MLARDAARRQRRREKQRRRGEEQRAKLEAMARTPPRSSRAGPRDHRVVKYLDEIVRHLERLGRDELLARLQPGLSSSEIRDELSRLGLPRCDGLVELYGWRNGTRVTPGTSLDDVHLFPGFYFLSLEDSISNFLAFREDDRWASTWLPVFANGGGAFYVVDFSSGSDLEHPVVGFMLDEAEHPIEYESLPAMIATIAECFEEGVLRGRPWVPRSGRRPPCGNRTAQQPASRDMENPDSSLEDALG
jgi:hypothetical protein